MSAPAWLRWTFAAAMIAVALYHLAGLLARLVETRVRRRAMAPDVELTHAAMGAVMTVMLVGTLAPADSRRLALVFAAPALWFAWRGMHSYVMDGPRAMGVPVRQAVGCAAMVYMLVVLAGSRTAMAGMSMPGSSVPSPVLGAVLVVATIGVAACAVSRMRVSPPGAMAPAVTAGCQLAMNVTTVYMLMAM